jgi:transposase
MSYADKDVRIRELESLLQAGDVRIRELESLLEAALERIGKLEHRLGLNSTNSSKPPSSDGLRRENRTRSERGRSGKKSGGQKGHTGNTLEMSKTPQYEVDHKVLECDGCGRCLRDVEPSQHKIRQVFDLPIIELEVTQHRAEEKRCPHCEKRVQAEFPETVRAPVQYGERVKSITTYLQYQHFIPEERVKTICEDVLGFSPAAATIAQYGEELRESLTGFEKAVKASVISAPIKHADETGYRVCGKTVWLHSLSTPTATWYETTPGRKRLVEDLSGILVHDGYKSYMKQSGVEHALCNAHHLRELRALMDIEKERWARHMHRFLRCANRIKNSYLDEIVPEAHYQRCKEVFHRILELGILYHEKLPPLAKPKRGRSPLRIGHNLALRLKNSCDAVLLFLVNPEVPFTNNLAEQDLRMMKVKQKISGGFRSVHGASTFCLIRSFLSTMRKQGKNIIASIAALFSHKTLSWDLL